MQNVVIYVNRTQDASSVAATPENDNIRVYAALPSASFFAVLFGIITLCSSVYYYVSSQKKNNHTNIISAALELKPVS